MSQLAGIKACVFDAYGTLFDFNSAVARCADIPEAKRAVLGSIWRDKQIQYTLLRSLQHRYADFEQVTAEALDYALESTGLADAGHRTQLLDLYRTVSAYPEVPAMLKALKAAGLATAILSNGTSAMLKAAIDHAEIGAELDHVLSVEAVGVFKPAPEVYQLAVDRLSLPRELICFISSNGWDAYGAAAFGFQVAWCNRTGQPAERLPGQPIIVLKTLSALAGGFATEFWPSSDGELWPTSTVERRVSSARSRSHSWTGRPKWNYSSSFVGSMSLGSAR